MFFFPILTYCYSSACQILLHSACQPRPPHQPTPLTCAPSCSLSAINSVYISSCCFTPSLCQMVLTSMQDLLALFLPEQPASVLTMSPSSTSPQLTSRPSLTRPDCRLPGKETCFISVCLFAGHCWFQPSLLSPHSNSSHFIYDATPASLPDSFSDCDYEAFACCYLCAAFGFTPQPLHTHHHHDYPSLGGKWAQRLNNPDQCCLVTRKLIMKWEDRIPSLQIMLCFYC